DQEQALAQFQEGERIVRKLMELSPTDEGNRRERMFILHKIADVHLGWNELDTAVREYKEALALIEAVVLTAPYRFDWRRDLANPKRKLGWAYRDQQQFGLAFEQFKQALEDLTELSQESNDNVTRSNLAGTHANIAVLYRQKATRDPDHLDR